MTTDLRTRVYVSGPYTSDPVPNTEMAIAVGQQLLEAGYAPMVPHLTHFWHQRFENDHATWMELDLPWVAAADVVVRLDGDSRGADEEVELALQLGIPVVSFCFASPCTVCLEDLQRAVPPGRPADLVHEQAGSVPEPIEQALQAMRDIFAKKNADYADDRDWKSNFADVATQMGFPTTDACEVLIAVKQARLRSLRVNGRTPVNEAVVDTVLDRAVYALIALAMQLEEQ